MPVFFVPDINENTYFGEEESRHCSKVLRLRNGETVKITDGKGNLYHCQLTDVHPKKTSFSIKETIASTTQPYSVHIAIAPTKNPDRIEWFVEKSVEIGVQDITLIQCERSERTHLKLDRLEKIAISALKQSAKTQLTKIHPITNYKDFIAGCTHSDRYIAHVLNNERKAIQPSLLLNPSYCILIGPEGDFSPKEIELALSNNYTPVSLGPSILRTETAGVVACLQTNLLHWNI